MSLVFLGCSTASFTDFESTLFCQTTKDLNSIHYFFPRRRRAATSGYKIEPLLLQFSIPTHGSFNYHPSIRTTLSTPSTTASMELSPRTQARTQYPELPDTHNNEHLKITSISLRQFLHSIYEKWLFVLREQIEAVTKSYFERRLSGMVHDPRVQCDLLTSLMAMGAFVVTSTRCSKIHTGTFYKALFQGYNEASGYQIQVLMLLVLHYQGATSVARTQCEAIINQITRDQ